MGSGCILDLFGGGICGELVTSASMVVGVAGREEVRGVSAMESLLERDGGGLTLETEGRGGEGSSYMNMQLHVHVCMYPDHTQSTSTCT